MRLPHTIGMRLWKDSFNHVGMVASANKITITGDRSDKDAVLAFCYLLDAQRYEFDARHLFYEENKGAVQFLSWVQHLSCRFDMGDELHLEIRETGEPLRPFEAAVAVVRAEIEGRSFRTPPKL